MQTIQGIAEDLRYAARGLRRSPGFALTAVTILAVGIGINAAVFTLSNAVLFSGFPSVKDNDRIAYIASDRSLDGLSYPDVVDWRAQATSFDDLAIVHGVTVSLSDSTGFPESGDATEVSPETFRLIGASPMLGRDFARGDEVAGAEPVAILSHEFWERRYSRDPAIVGRVIRINGAPTTVIGVMPEGFAFPQKQDLWVPLVLTPELLRRDWRSLWFAFGRLADGATVESARAEMNAIGERLAREYPATNRDYRPAVRTFNEFFIGPSENVVYRAMWGAVAFVLLIACANLANLMLARAIDRTREIAVRVALGAGRWRIVRQLVTESLMLAAAGGVLGWWIAKTAVRAYSLAERGPGFFSWRVLDYTMDYRILGYLVVITIATGVLFGLAPARRLAQLNVNPSLKDGDRGAGTSIAGTRLSSLLVTAEVALAVVVLSGAGLMIRGYLSISTTDPGVTTENVLAAYVQLPVDRYPDAELQTGLFARLEQRLEALPGVESVSFASALPASGSRLAPYEIDDERPAGDQRRPEAAALVVGTDYFRTLEAPVLAGREFEDTDDATRPPVVIVNEYFASRRWPGEEVLGKRLRLVDGETPGAWLTVVGVASNIMQSDTTRQELGPVVYLPHRQTPRSGLWMLARTLIPPASLANDFRRELQALDADLPIMLGPYPLGQRMAESYWDSELYARLFVIVAAIALLLAAAGIYAIVSYSVARQTQEIGVRMAIGANPRDILVLVLRQGLPPIGAGLLIGIALSVGLARLLESMLVQVYPTDPGAFAAATGVLLLAALLGCWIPARRAIRVDPVIALKAQ